MSRRASTAVVLASSALWFVGAALATPQRPTDRSCLLAWNASGNQANRARLLSERPLAALQLLPGSTGTDTWAPGSTTSTSSPACLLTLLRSGEVRVVVGTWRAGRVAHWSFGSSIPARRRPLSGNVRLLADGRVAKIYRR